VWDYRIAHASAGPPESAVQTRLIIPDATLDELAGAGVRTLALHEHWTDIESYVSTAYGEELKKFVRACHARGMQVPLYSGLLISDLASEWPEFGDECVVMPPRGYEPYIEPPQSRQNAYNVCYNSIWQDFLAAGIAQNCARAAAAQAAPAVHLDAGKSNQVFTCRPDADNEFILRRKRSRPLGVLFHQKMYSQPFSA